MMEMQAVDDAALVPKEPPIAVVAPAAAAASSAGSAGGWGWGAWKSSAFSVLNEIQQAAADAAEEIQKNVSPMRACYFRDLHSAACSLGQPSCGCVCCMR